MMVRTVQFYVEAKRVSSTCPADWARIAMVVQEVAMVVQEADQSNLQRSAVLVGCNAMPERRGRVRLQGFSSCLPVLR